MEKILITLTALVLLGWLTRSRLAKANYLGKRIWWTGVAQLIASTSVFASWFCFVSKNAAKSPDAKNFGIVLIALASICILFFSLQYLLAWLARPKKSHGILYLGACEPGNELEDTP